MPASNDPGLTPAQLASLYPSMTENAEIRSSFKKALDTSLTDDERELAARAAYPATTDWGTPEPTPQITEEERKAREMYPASDHRSDAERAAVQPVKPAEQPVAADEDVDLDLSQLSEPNPEWVPEVLETYTPEEIDTPALEALRELPLSDGDKEFLTALALDAAEASEETRSEWKEASLERYTKQEMALARKTLRKLDRTGELRRHLNASKLGDHPQVIEGLLAIAQVARRKK